LSLTLGGESIAIGGELMTIVKLARMVHLREREQAVYKLLHVLKQEHG
jgi:hypothetical protein